MKTGKNEHAAAERITGNFINAIGFIINEPENILRMRNKCKRNIRFHTCWPDKICNRGINEVSVNYRSACVAQARGQFQGTLDPFVADREIGSKLLMG